MSAKTFEETLANIKEQSSLLNNLDERAVEIAVVLPLLSSIGWNTGNMAEVYPQSKVDSGGKVDYELKVDGQSRVLVEVKSWNHALREAEENQLEGYCRQAKPKLAVLTSGNRWMFYLPPTRGKYAKLRLFLDFDITTLDPLKVQDNFGSFLARDKFSTKYSTAEVVKEAKKVFEARQNLDAAFQRMTDAWNSLTEDPQPLLAFIEAITDPNPDEEQVEQFLESVQSPLVNQAITSPPTPAQPAKPYSFTFQEESEILVKSHWSRLLVELCLLVHKDHPDDFGKILLEMPDWFTESAPQSGNWPKRIGDTGIYAHYGAGNDIRDRCQVILGKFGYPSSALTIKLNSGEVVAL